MRAMSGTFVQNMYDLGNVEYLSPILVIYHAFVYCPTLKLKNATIMTKIFDRLLGRSP